MNIKSLITKISIGMIITFLALTFIQEDKKPKFKTITDSRDGKEYLTVKIGKQWWFAENLNFETDKSWCHACDTYGRMYTYESAMEACPEGWHIPSVNEWNKLITTLGGSEIAGGKMKSIEKWRKPNVGADNSSGFSAIPSPQKGVRGEIRNPREATWWTADKALDPAAWTMSIKSEEAGIYQMGYYRVSGFSVRCIKD